ncbi:MAG: glycosyltransferase family 2 protein [Pirellulaceae bacterium]|nr:glycosyltransferase family 2 protein [Pirellulaceae bacterium]
MSVSIVVPVYDEIENIQPLYERISAIIPTLNVDCEILFVNDGSKDGTGNALDTLAKNDKRVKVVHFRRNYGQTAAMHAGLKMASGAVIVTMDGDLQNDPDDIKMMLEKIDDGYDLVHGWRKNRKDNWINRKLPSKVANWIISKTTGFPIHDLGCTLKAMRREIAQELELYGEMHRFIPLLAHERGARCAEVVTKHHARQFGETKYGIGRTFRVVLDLITVKYMLKYFASPMKLFGMFGLVCSLLTVASGSTTVAMKAVGGIDMTGNPLLLCTVFLGMVAMQFFSIGLLGEVNARIYYSSQQKQNFTVRKLVNFDKPKEPIENIRQAA